MKALLVVLLCCLTFSAHGARSAAKLVRTDCGTDLDARIQDALSEVGVVPSRQAEIYGDATKLSAEAQSLLEFFHRFHVGQEHVYQEVANAYVMFEAGIRNPDKPLGSFLFMGPTGTGKTLIPELLAEYAFGDRRALIKIDSAEFSHSHEISKLIGSPPGYLGHQETLPFLAQQNVNRYKTDKHPFFIVVLDEIEKANDALWQLFLGILDKGRATMGNNKTTDFTDAIIFMTSNLGAKEVQTLAGLRGIGIRPHQSDTIGRKDPGVRKRMEAAHMQAAKKHFTPEFLNRIDHKLTFLGLGEPELLRILELEIGRLNTRLIRQNTLALLVSEPVKQFLKQEMNSHENGRSVVRAVERHVMQPMARLIATEQAKASDLWIAESRTGKVPHSVDDMQFRRLQKGIDQATLFDLNERLYYESPTQP